MIHVDLDGCGPIFRNHSRSWDHSEDPLYQSGFTHLLELLDAMSIQATLFTIAEDLDSPAKRELLEEAVRRGHDIASHTITHPRLNTLSREDKTVEIRESRARLEQALGVSVTGFRAPSFSIDRECLELLEEAGYEYDSSVFPNDRFAQQLKVITLGQSPHRPVVGNELLELPLPSYEGRPFPFHPSYSLMLGDFYFQSGLRRYRSCEAPLVLLFHLTDLSDPLPKEQLPSFKLRLMTLSHLSAATKMTRCRKMLNQVADLYSMTNTQDFLRQVAPAAN